MLMTPITPKVMARPIAARRSTEPSDRPYQTFWAASHIASSPSIAETASVAAAPTGPSISVSGNEQRQRIATAAGLDHLDRRDLLLVGTIGFEHRRGARFAHQLGDGRILLLGDRRVDQFDRIRVAALEDRFGRRAPGRAVGAHQGEGAERGADGAPQPVVHLDLVDRARRDLVDRLAGQRIDQLVVRSGLLGDEDHVVGFARIDVAVVERFKDRDRCRIAGRRDRDDLRLGFGVAANGQAIDQVAQVGVLCGGADGGSEGRSVSPERPG